MSSPVPQWRVDECAAYFGRMLLRGWCFHAAPTIVAVAAVFPEPPATVPLLSYGRPSPDVAANLDPAASQCRFEEWIAVPDEALGRDFTLRFTLADGSCVDSDSALRNAADGDPFFGAFGRFQQRLEALPPGEILEIGSRARSAITRRGLIPAHLKYVGLDILDGPNVDVIGDAHALAAQFSSGRFSAVFSFSVFEHLAMPWKVALELNHVLAPGGLVFTQTHQSWPVHDLPWDFWRYSPYTWRTLFNAATGFEVIEAVCGDPARLHPCCTNPATRVLLGSREAYLGSASLVRKIGPTDLTWPVPTATATAAMYPAGELSRPPS